MALVHNEKTAPVSRDGVNNHKMFQPNLGRSYLGILQLDQFHRFKAASHRHVDEIDSGSQIIN